MNNRLKKKIIGAVLGGAVVLGAFGFVVTNYVSQKNVSANTPTAADDNAQNISYEHLEDSYIPAGTAADYASIVGNEQAVKDKAVELTKKWLGAYGLTDESLQKIEIASIKDKEETKVIGAFLRISYAEYPFATAIVDFTDEEQVYRVDENSYYQAEEYESNEEAN